jgi:hypothetical protein
MSKMRNSCHYPQEEVDNGRTPRQARKKDPTRNRIVRLSKVSQTIPRSTEQEENLDTAWSKDDVGNQFPTLPLFFNLSKTVSFNVEKPTSQGAIRIAEGGRWQQR